MGRACLNRVIMVVITALVILTVAQLKAEETFQPDIVPWPKQIKLESVVWELSDGKDASVFILTGKNPAPQVQAGAALLEKKLKQLGVSFIVKDDTASTSEMPSSLVIRIGVAGQDTWLSKAIGDAGISISEKDPGEQGYVICSRLDKGQRQILLAGSDPVGALYACVTAKSLISMKDGRASIWPVQIRDYPDLKQRWLGTPQWHGTGSDHYLLCDIGWKSPASEEFKSASARHMEINRKYIDWLVDNKINGMARHTVPINTWLEDVPPAARQVAKAINEYALARGVRTFLQETVELIPSESCQKNSHYDWWKGISFNKGAGRGSNSCWCRDDLVQRKAEQIGKYIRETSTSAVWIHATDTGSYTDPGAWGKRCEKCRQKWGDDYAGATAHLFDVFIKGIRAECPESIVVPIPYPYNLEILDPSWRPEAGIGDAAAAAKVKGNMENLWRTMGQTLPKDIPILIRECTQPAISEFRKLTEPHPLFTYFETNGSYGWQPEFTTSFRYMKTFYRTDADIVWVSDDRQGVATFIGAAEYSWNTGGFGATGWTPYTAASCHETEEIMNKVLPRLCRSIWGSDIGNQMVKALSPNVAIPYISDPDMVPRHIGDVSFKDVSRMEQQYKGAEHAAQILDGICNQVSKHPKIMEGAYPNIWQYVAKLRLEMHAAAPAAFGWYALWQSENMIKKGQIQEAGTLLAQAIQKIQQAEEDLEKVKNELASSPYPCSFTVKSSKKPADNSLNFNRKIYFFDFASMKEKLDIMVLNKEKLARQHWPEPALKAIKDRHVKAVRATTPPQLDGIPDEPVWQTAETVQFFIRYPDDNLHFADSETNVRILFDDQNLYLGIRAWLENKGKYAVKEGTQRDGNIWSGQDSIEIFLVPPAPAKDYFQFAVTPEPAIFDARLRLNNPADIKWDSGIEVATQVKNKYNYWTAEIKIPFRGLGAVPKTGDEWKILLVRNIGKGKTISPTTIIPLTVTEGFHASQSKYPDLKFTEPGIPSSPITASIICDKPEIRMQTLKDREASVVRLPLKITSDAILHGGYLTARAVDENNQEIALLPPIGIDTMDFSWEPPAPLELILDKERSEVTVVIRLITLDGVSIKKTISVKQAAR